LCDHDHSAVELRFIALRFFSLRVAVNRLEEKDRTGQDRTGQGNRQLAIAAKVDVWNLQKKKTALL